VHVEQWSYAAIVVVVLKRRAGITQKAFIDHMSPLLALFWNKPFKILIVAACMIVVKPFPLSW
jgi:hypothetical protein